MISSAGAGKAMAEWVMDGEPGLDLWALDIARFGRSAGSKYFVVSQGLLAGLMILPCAMTIDRFVQGRRD